MRFAQAENATQLVLGASPSIAVGGAHAGVR